METKCAISLNLDDIAVQAALVWGLSNQRAADSGPWDMVSGACLPEERRTDGRCGLEGQPGHLKTPNATQHRRHTGYSVKVGMKVREIWRITLNRTPFMSTGL